MPEVSVVTALGQAGVPQRASLVPADTARPLVQTRRLIVRGLAPQSRLQLRMRERDVGPSTSIDGLALGAPINSRRSHGDRTALRLGPDEWLISCPDVALAAMQREMAEALGPTFHVLVDVSHRHAAFILEGDGAVATLNAGCPLDLDERIFPVGMATRTLLGKVEVILARVGDEPRFELLCWRSYARYLTAFLAEAAATLE